MNNKRFTVVLLAFVVIAGMALVARWNREDKAAGIATEAPDANQDEMLASGHKTHLPAQPKAGHEEITPELLDSLTTAEAQIIRGDGSKVDMRSIDGEFDYLLVYPNEHLRIRVALKNGDASAPVLIEADNGGSLNQQVGPLCLPPAAGEGAIEFHYAIGGNSGKYTLFLSQGERQEFMEFWAGPETPLGQAGPPRSFSPVYEQTRRTGK